MGAFKYTNDFSKGVNLDLDELRLPADAVAFLKNITRNVNANGGPSQGVNSGAGSNKDVGTPLEGNVALTMSGLASGPNYCIGFYSSEQTNEGYFFLYNGYGDHSIWVIRGDNGTTQKVYEGPLLNFQYNPENFISTGRCTLELKSYIDPESGEETNYKFLCFTDNYNEPRLISVEDSIATGSFTAPATYFAGAGTNYIEETLITLGVPLPIHCIGLNTPDAYVPYNTDTGIDAVIVALGGLDWEVGDTFIVPAGSPVAEGQVIEVGPGGVATKVIITYSGEGYGLSSYPTSATSGVGTGLVISVDSLRLPDSALQNMVVRRAWQFRVKFIDVFGRESEHGIISSQYITIVGGGCITASNGLPRCLNLNFDAGNPLVNHIQVEYRLWVDGTTPFDGDWQLYDTLSKWDNSGGTQWYDRVINPYLVYDSATNMITYTFCADRESGPIPVSETSRTEPGVPRMSSTIFSITKRIGLGNNVRGFQPIDPAELAKITLSAITPATAPCPAPPNRTVIVYANIYIPAAGGTSRIRKVDGKWVWGQSPGTCADAGSTFSFDQVFGDQENPGFIGYMAGVAGAGMAVVGRQGNLDTVTGIFTPVDLNSTSAFTDICVQQFTFTIPAGKYVFRIASHKASLSSPELQQTSTYVGGRCSVYQLTSAPGDRDDYARFPYKEIEIDCTCDNVILNQPTDPVMIILDLGVPGGSAAIDGYLFEKEGENTPVEMTPVLLQGLSGGGTFIDVYGSFFTDHNGFYFGTVAAAGTIQALIYADYCDGAGSALRQIYVNSSGGIGGGGVWHGDGSNTPAGACVGLAGKWDNRVYLKRSTETFPECARRRIDIDIKLCDDHDTGIPGIPIVMTKGAVAITNASGEAQIIAHGRYNFASSIGGNPIPFLAGGVPDFSVFPFNGDDLIYSQKGGCQWVACSGTPCGSITSACVPSLPSYTVAYIACCTPCETCRTTTVPEVYVTVLATNISGIQSGGRYPIAVVLHDLLGRHTFAQKVGYVEAANINDTGYQRFVLQNIGYNIEASFQVPTVFKYMTFAVGENTLFTDFFSWAADWVQFIDNTGVTNEVNPTAVRIYYASLTEYNKAYNFSTETGWQFLSTDQNGNPLDAPVTGDIVQFIMNGDGTWIDGVVSAPVTYEKAGAFFTVDYTGELAGLTNGCLFRVIRPSQIKNGENNTYYEQCLTIELDNNGNVPAPQRTGTLPYFDSYLLSRLLPVPLLGGNTGPVPPGGDPATIQYTSTGNTALGFTTGAYATNNRQNSNGVVIMQTRDVNTAFPFYFESPSPSDFWGNHVANRGRIFVSNPYEAQLRTGTEIALSDALTDRGNLNGLSYFQNTNAQVFDRNTWGNITVVLVETSVMLVICDRDHFLTRYNTTQLEVGENGVVSAQNQLGIFTSPLRKAGSNYGCNPFDINSVAKYTGIAVWIDSGGYLVFHNFSEARPVEFNGYDAYLKNKIGYNNRQNIITDGYGLLGRRYFAGGIDVKTWEYYLTSFAALRFITSIATAAPLPGVGGTGYMVGSAFTISGGSPVAVGIVTAIGPGGAATAISIEFGGEGYELATGYPTVTLSGGGSGLVVDVQTYTSPDYLNELSSPDLSANETLIIDLDKGTLKGMASFTPEIMGNISGFYTQPNFITFKNGAPYVHHTNRATVIGSPPPYANFYGTQCECRITVVCNSGPENVKRFFYVEVRNREGIGGGTGVSLPQTLFYADAITTEKLQSSRLKPLRFVQKDGIWCAEFLCDLNTPADPNIPTQTGANKLLDGNPLQGRWLKSSFVTQATWTGAYYEISGIMIAGNDLSNKPGQG